MMLNLSGPTKEDESIADLHWEKLHWICMDHRKACDRIPLPLGMPSLIGLMSKLLEGAKDAINEVSEGADKHHTY